MKQRTSSSITIRTLTVVSIVALATVVLPVRASATTAVEKQGSSNNYQLIDTDDGWTTGPADECTSGPWTALFAPGNNEDDSDVSYTAPFAIDFYGSPIPEINIGVNGGISMNGHSGVSAINGLITGANPVAVYPFWDDLEFDNTDAAHNVFVCTDGTSPNQVLKVLWFNVDCSLCDAATGETITFAVRFHEVDASIEFVYADTFFSAGDPRNDGDDATIGFTDGTGDRYLRYSYNIESIQANPWAIRFYPAMCGDTPATLAATRAGDRIVGTSADDVIAGHYGNDDIRGEAGNDTICGGLGADELNGGPDDDTIYGGGGEDEIDGRGGADIIYGGPGGDTISGDGGLDTIYGEGGEDTIDGRGAADNIDGGPGGDIIGGHEGGDILWGGGGLDTITGNTGPDELRGGGEDDTLRGGEGNDIMYGGGGTDLCSGNTGPNDQAQAASCESAPGIETLF